MYIMEGKGLEVKCSQICGSVKALLLDIEGTTTPITFVTEKLFPYVKEHLESFLTSNFNTKEVSTIIAQLRKQSNIDVDSGISNVPKVIEGDSVDVLPSVIAYILWLMTLNKKTTALKELQGRIWRSGYDSGEIIGDVFEDVQPALKEWRASGRSIYVYSSGSIEAQKLLFKHSVNGNMLPLLDGHFDTTTGHKTQEDSYYKIAKEIGVSTDEVLFITDVQAEADAALSCKMNVFVMLRPGNKRIDEQDNYICIDNFTYLNVGKS